MKIQSRLISRSVVCLGGLLFGVCSNLLVADKVPATSPSVSFVSAAQDFPRLEKNLRKWETPVVADLDQDGWVDLVLNDHGFSIQVMWNNEGKFAPPWDLLMGDAHGISVGDLDRDGLLEMIVSRGGGSGSNARNSIIYRIERDRTFTRLPEFPEPLAFMRGRTVKFIDGDNDGALDLLNFAFPSREMKGQSENYIYRNDGEGTLVRHAELPPSRANGQMVLITDFDGDGSDDLLMYGNGKLRAFRANGDLTYTEVGDQVFEAPIKQVTGIVELDYDHDGDFDLYLSRGEEMSAGDAFYNPATEAWGFMAKRGKFQFEDVAIGDVLRIENFQSPWPNKKIYTGEPAHDYEWEGETHSGKDVRFVNSDTLGWPDELTNKGLYLGYVGNARWRFAGETWSPLSAVIHGVKDGPVTGSTVGPADLLLENRGGRFVDVTEKAGIDLAEHTTGVVAVDLDNNGFEDLLVMRRGDLVSANDAVLWLNQGDGSFREITMHGVVSPELGAIGMGVEALDYDRDGQMDVLLGNERGKWHLFRNESAGNSNFVTVDLGAAMPGKATTLGATITVRSGDQTQVKRSGSGGAPYARSFDRYVHFGLGDYRGPVSVEVRLSNGETLSRTVGSPGATVAIEHE